MRIVHEIDGEATITVDGLIARFQEMIDWLRERGHLDIEVGID